MKETNYVAGFNFHTTEIYMLGILYIRERNSLVSVFVSSNNRIIEKYKKRIKSKLRSWKGFSCCGVRNREIFRLGGVLGRLRKRIRDGWWWRGERI